MIVRKVRFKDKSLLGITIFPFIFMNKWLYDKKINQASINTIINHESIHIRQQEELLIIPFYIWYVIEYLIRRLQYPTWYKAYQNISFEREAYKHERNLEYLKTRKWYSWFKYLWFKNYNKW